MNQCTSPTCNQRYMCHFRKCATSAPAEFRRKTSRVSQNRAGTWATLGTEVPHLRKGRVSWLQNSFLANCKVHGVPMNAVSNAKGALNASLRPWSRRAA